MKINHYLAGISLATVGVFPALALALATGILPSGCHKPDANGSTVGVSSSNNSNNHESNSNTNNHESADPTAKDYLADLGAHGLKAEYLGRLATDDTLYNSNTSVDCRVYRMVDSATKHVFYVVTNNQSHGSCAIVKDH
jgi:hypothetical protein